jgi:L-threonylcarbamoyladenylate synthase
MAPPLTADDAARLSACLARDGVAVIPTDTVYGLAFPPDSEAAVRRVYELKRRTALKPCAVMFFALDPALRALPALGPRTEAALRALLPGPVTLLLPNPERRYRPACDPAGAGSGLLGLRVPSLAPPLAALAAVSAPVAQSSANLSGNPDPRLLSDVPRSLREGSDLVLDGGPLPGVASTVIDLSGYERSGGWRIVREGPLARARVEGVLGVPAGRPRGVLDAPDR